MFSLMIRGANLILLSFFQNLFCKQNNDPGQRIAEGPGEHVGICRFVLIPVHILPSKDKKAKCPCVSRSACVSVHVERRGRQRAYRN